MPVKILITKPVKMDLLIAEFSAAGFRQTSSRPDEFITVEDSNDTIAVMAIYDAHDANRLTPQEQTTKDALTNYSTLTAWAKTGTAAEAETYINGQIFNGQTPAQVNAWIDATIKETLIVNITTANVTQINAQLANIRTQLSATRTVFKAAASAIIAMRDLFVLTAKLLIYIRDLVIRFR